MDRCVGLTPAATPSTSGRIAPPHRATSHLLPRVWGGKDRSPMRETPVCNAATAIDSSAPARPSTYPTQQALDTALTQRMDTDQVQEVEMQVQGQLPAWLQGSYLKNGPGTFKGMTHLFDGYGQVTKARFDGSGKAFFSSRYVESNAWRAFRDSGGQRMAYMEFGTKVPFMQNLGNTAVQLLGLGQGVTDNSSVSLVPGWAPGETLAVTETPSGTYRVSEETLETLGQVRYRDKVGGDLTTAHGTVVGGRLVNLTSGFGGSYTLYEQALGSEERRVIARVPIRNPLAPSWIHDFPVTQNYAVIPDTPVTFSLKAFMGGSAPYVVFDWEPSARSVLHVVRLSDGKVTSYDAPCFFTFHYVNAFESEDGSSLSFDFGWAEGPGMLNNLLLRNMREGTMDILDSPLRRITLQLGDEPPSPSSVSVTDLTTDPGSYVQCELPTVNPDNKTKPYRYAYGVAGVRPCTFGNVLAKWDVASGSTALWHEPGCIPGEPLFVGRPGAGADEDDGVVVSYVVGGNGSPYLLVLDGRSFEEVARCVLPPGMVLGYQFHGKFVRAAASSG